MATTIERCTFWCRHLRKLILTPLGIAVALWFLVIQPRMTTTVDEAFPTAAPRAAAVLAVALTATTTAPTLAPSPVPTAVPAIAIAPVIATTSPTVIPATAVLLTTMPTDVPATIAPTVAPAAPPPTVAAATGPVALKGGQLAKVDEDGSGTATIYRLPDGTYILRLDNFQVTNGPDLRVRVLGPTGALDLGGLKGNRGNQTYALPADFDPAAYDAADIWCRSFRVAFVKAQLA